MATRSVVAYADENGDIRGTYVHWDGYPENMKPALREMLDDLGYEGVVEWIENGIEGGGYSEVGDVNPYHDGEQNCKIDQEEYGYFVFSNGEVTVAHG